jgi:hypothetical protein
MQCLEDLDLRLVIHLVRGQSVRTPMSVKVWCVENHFPKELQLESLRLSDAMMQSELLEHDLA